MQKAGFTLIEILVVLVILGFLGAMVVPMLDNTTQMSKSNINKTMMQDIKRASLAFKNDVGFVPDNVVLMIYPFEKCQVKDKNHDISAMSATCKNIIAFVDSRLNIDDYRIVDGTEGDYGNDTRREQNLIDEIKRRLDPKQNGWRGSYIGGNGHLLMDKNQTDSIGNRFFLSPKDVDIYYDGWEDTDTLSDIGVGDVDAKKWFCIKAADFNGTRHSSGFNINIECDEYYDTAKYRNNLEGELTILDPWGTPYEIQFPLQSVIPSGKSRERFARIVSFGKNRQRDSEVNATLPVDVDATNYDDSVLYIFDNNQTSYFHQY